MPMKARYTVIDGEIIAENRSGVRKQYVPDPLGSTVALLDNTQTQTDTFSYWPYGEVASRTGSTPTQFRFVGTEGYFSTISGSFYVITRYFDAVTGRWNSLDTIQDNGDGWNNYQYCHSAPTSFTDPLGQATEKKKPPRKGKVCPPGYKLVSITAYGDNAGCTGKDCNITYWKQCDCSKERLPQLGDCAIDEGAPVCSPGQYVDIIKNNLSHTNCRACDGGQGHGGLDIKVTGQDSDTDNIDRQWQTGKYCVKCLTTKPGGGAKPGVGAGKHEPVVPRIPLRLHGLGRY